MALLLTVVDITWMSISNVLYELGTFGVLTDGFISRIPRRAFFGGGDAVKKALGFWRPPDP